MGCDPLCRLKLLMRREDPSVLEGKVDGSHLCVLILEFSCENYHISICSQSLGPSLHHICFYFWASPWKAYDARDTMKGPPACTRPSLPALPSGRLPECSAHRQPRPASHLRSFCGAVILNVARRSQPEKNMIRKQENLKSKDKERRANIVTPPPPIPYIPQNYAS